MDIAFSVVSCLFQVVALVGRDPTWIKIECCIRTNCLMFKENLRQPQKKISHISNLFWVHLNQRNNHKMHRKVNILNIYFFLLLTENQFKVVFRVNFWLHYQIGHNYKEDEFILSIWICILSNQTSPLGTIPQAAKG